MTVGDKVSVCTWRQDPGVNKAQRLRVVSRWQEATVIEVRGTCFVAEYKIDGCPWSKILNFTDQGTDWK